MISNVLKKNREAMIKMYQKMTPEQRLVAFLNHSRLVHKLYQAGQKAQVPSLKNKTRLRKRTS